MALKCCKNQCTSSNRFFWCDASYLLGICRLRNEKYSLKLSMMVYIILYIDFILASCKYFTTNGSVSIPIAFPMVKSLDISVLSFLLSFCRYPILYSRAHFTKKLTIFLQERKKRAEIGRS